MISSVLTNVPSSTADLLSYAMLVVVAVFLVSGPIITYYYWRKIKRTKVVSPTATT